MEKLIFSLEKYKESMGYDDCPQWAYDIDGKVCDDCQVQLFDDFSLYLVIDYSNDNSYIVSSDWVEVVNVD